ncbi:MAG: phosphoesterase [Caulobacteraceae bacterium]|nr:phosphoesterase [Caulobacteraceae bacterium]
MKLENRPCGGLNMVIGQAPVLLRASGALWLENERLLAVADLHFEKGSFFAARGQMLPPYDTAETLNRLEAEVAALRPATLVLLGDSFHDPSSEERLGRSDRDRIAALGTGRRLIWIVGNHDAGGLDGLGGQVADLLEVSGLTLRHDPLPGARPGEVAGHLHPCAKVAGVGGSVRRRCFATDGERLILPAFGAYAGGLNLRDPAYADLFERAPIAAVMGRSRLHAVGWRSLRPD